VALDSQVKTITENERGMDGEGEEGTSKNVITKTGKDTLTWQALERTGVAGKGTSPAYEFKRVKRTGKKAAK
jgi:hypothetical protein